MPQFLGIDRNLLTETIAAESLGTAVAIGPRKIIGISTDRAARVAFGNAATITAGPLVASYSESNQDSTANISSADLQGVGQSFTIHAPPGVTLASAKFHLKKTLLPTGNATAKVYASTGVHGTAAIPSGAALATSGNLDVSTLTGALALVEFTFSGANKIALTSGTTYVLTVEYSGGDGANNVQAGYDGSAPTHAGNYSELSGTWSAQSGRDVCFYLYVTANDLVLPAAGIYTADNEAEHSHLVVYNPDTVTSVITSVFEYFG